MSIFNSKSQLVVVNLYTISEVSILNSCKDILDEKIWREKKRTNIGKNKYEKAHFQFNDTTCRCEPVY